MSEPFQPIDPLVLGLRKLAYTPAEVMELVGISRAPFYRLVKEGEIKISRHGTRTLILAMDLARFLLKMRKEGLPSRPRREGEPPRIFPARPNAADPPARSVSAREGA